jgi:hypothetical protein
MVMPYFLSSPNFDAMTTDAQSVRGMNPILTTVFSGASEPAAYAADEGRISELAAVAAPAAIIEFLRKSRRLELGTIIDSDFSDPSVGLVESL